MNLIKVTKDGSEQFAGWGLTDHVAVCLACRVKHLIHKGEQISAQPWLDWQAKHGGHPTRIVPYRLLSRLADRLAEFLSPFGQFASNADAKAAYAASSAYTITLTGLASDTNLLAGRESTGLSNASNKYLDELIAGMTTVGTSPTAARLLEHHAVGALNDTPLYPDVFDGTDSVETVTSVDIKGSICKPLAIIPTASTSDRMYPWGPVGLRQLFGDLLPPAHTIFVVHNTGVNLHATAANHAAYHTPVFATVT